jgi:GNAT superfamily N-acetyltransferase
MTAVRRIRADDVEIFREVRLRALETDPLAFASTLAREQAFVDEWAERAAGSAASDDRSLFLAIDDDGTAFGIAGGFRDVDTAGRFYLFSMWVAPEQRRGGYATLLVEAVADWARAAGGRELSLDVTDPGAMRFYERIGFRDDGRRMPLQHTPTVIEIGMTRPLAGGSQ